MNIKNLIDKLEEIARDHGPDVEVELSLDNEHGDNITPSGLFKFDYDESDEVVQINNFR